MKRRFAVLAVAVLLLSACSNSVTIPANAAYDLAGQYSGTATDSVLGNATAATTLAETGSTLSGTVVLTSTTNATLTQNVSWSISSTYALSGTTTATESGGSCTFSSTGQYNTNSNVISGTFTAVSGCSGETGTFALTQQCTNPATPADARRQLTRPTSC